MSNESKIGLLAIVSIGLAFWGYQFVRGQNIFKTSNSYYVYYQEINQLSVSTPVVINGFQVGIVSSIELDPPNYDQIVVTLDLERDITIPKSTVATIISTSFLGGKAIDLDFEGGCSGNDCAKNGDTLNGRTKSLVGSMVGEETVESYVAIIRDGLQEVLDTLNNQLLGDGSDNLVAQSARDLRSTLGNLKSTTTQLDQLLRKSSGNIDGTLDNVKSLTDTLNSRADAIAGILDNADSFSNQLAEIDLKGTSEEAKAAIQKLSGTLDNADVALADMAILLNKIKSGEGTLGQLITDEQLYNRLNTLSATADTLLGDIQDRPYRYVPFKGRKRVQRYDKKDAKEEEKTGS